MNIQSNTDFPSVLEFVEFWTTLITSLLVFSVIIWTLYVIKLRLTLAFAVILSLYTILQLLEITKCILGETVQSGFKIFS